MKHTYKQTLHACYTAYITQAIINNLAPLLFVIFQDQYHVTLEEIGRLIFINFGTQIVVDFLAMRFVDRIGYRPSAVLAHGFCVAGLVCLSLLPGLLPSAYLGLVVSVVIYALGGGLLEVLVSPIVDSLPGEQKESAMSLLHSFYCWGQMAVVLISTLLLRVIGNTSWMLLPTLWALVPLWNLFRFLKVPLLPPVPEEHRKPLKNLLRSKFFLIALILMMCAGASEISMSQWSSLFAEKGLGVPKVLGDLLGPCLFAVFMGIGRTLYGLFGAKINLKNALLLCGALCVGCYALTVFSPSPLFSLFGCALCGFSVSLMWPGTISLTSAKFPLGGTTMFGLLAVFGDIGAAVGPWMAGVVSEFSQKSETLLTLGAAQGIGPEQLGLKCGLFAAMLFPITLLVGILLLKRERGLARR
jgi:fucose permease